MSVPRRKPLSTNDGICALATSTIDGNASIVARPLSSTRTPQFETVMPSMSEAMSRNSPYQSTAARIHRARAGKSVSTENVQKGRNVALMRTFVIVRLSRLTSARLGDINHQCATASLTHC